MSKVVQPPPSFQSTFAPPETHLMASSFAEETDNEQSRYQDLASKLPKLGNTQVPLRLYRGYCLPEYVVPSMLSFEDHYKARTDDVVVASFPKCGTTWLKALVLSLVVRKDYFPTDQQHPLLSHNPHECFGFFETDRYPEVLRSPRLFGSHLPYSLLPESLRTTHGCRVLYICREPKDNFVSMWHFVESILTPSIERISLEDTFGNYCSGTSAYGPVWEHMLEYWEEQRRNPEKVLFLKFEDLKRDAKGVLVRVAEFLGYPFSPEEETAGVVDEILKLCSIENMRSMEVNVAGKHEAGGGFSIEHKTYFRKGKVGDWANLLTPEMGERLDKIMEEKLAGSGLSFKK